MIRIGTVKNADGIYQPPYWDSVGIDPSIEEMRKVMSVYFYNERMVVTV